MSASGSDVEAAQERTAWFREARLGMFVHWGLYSQAGGVWKARRHYGVAEYLQQVARIPNADYAALAADFDPQGFDAREWVRCAKQAGFKYIVVTAKHHEGFAMYDSAVDPFNIVEASPYGRDPLKALAEAARAEGIRLGFYYSQYLDWRDADAAGNDWDFPAGPRDFSAYMQRKALPQLEELLTNYGPIGVLWFDIPGASTPEQSQAWVDLVRRLQPDTLISSRVGNGLGDFENFGDNEIPPREVDARPWESIFTHNHSWSFSSHDHTFKSPKALIRMVATVAARGGNTMINVGPDPTGRFPAPTAEAFHALGDWMADNGQSIHATQRSPLGPLPWGVATWRPGSLFLHVLERPRDGGLIVPQAARLTPTGATFLATGGAVSWRLEGEDLWLDLPDELPDSRNTVLAIDVDETPPKLGAPATILSAQYEGLTLDVTSVDLSRGLRVTRVRGWGYFGHNNYFSSMEGLVSSDTAAVWDVRVIEPGDYWIAVEYAATRAQAGREAVVEFCGAELPFQILETGESDPYRLTPIYRHELGRVSVAEAGRYALSLRPSQTVAGSYQANLRPGHGEAELFTFKRLILRPQD